MNEALIFLAATAVGSGFGWWLRSRRADKDAAKLSEALGGKIDQEMGANAEAMTVIEAHATLVSDLCRAAFPDGGYTKANAESLLERVGLLGRHYYWKVRRDREKLLDKMRKKKRIKGQSRRDRKKTRQAA